MAHPPNNDNLQTYKIVVVGDGGGKLKPILSSSAV